MKRISISDLQGLGGVADTGRQPFRITSQAEDEDPVINPYNPLVIPDVYVIAYRNHYYDLDYNHYQHSPYYNEGETGSPYFPPIKWPQEGYYYDNSVAYYAYYSGGSYGDSYSQPNPNPEPKPDPAPKPDWRKLTDREKIAIYLNAILQAYKNNDPYFNLRKIVTNFPEAVADKTIKLTGSVKLNGISVEIELWLHVDSKMDTKVLLTDKGPDREQRYDIYELYYYNGEGQNDGWAMSEIHVQKGHEDLFESIFPIKGDSFD